MTMTKTWEGDGRGDGLGLGLAELVGVAAAGAWAAILGAHAARRHAEVTRATSRIPYEGTRRT